MDKLPLTVEAACNNNKFKYKFMLLAVKDKEESQLLNVLIAQTTLEFQMILNHVLLAVLVGSLKKTDHARCAQLDKLLLPMEDHACSFVDQEKEESAQPNALHAQHTPNFHLMVKHANLAQSDGLLPQEECAQDAQLVLSLKTKELAKKMLSAHHTPDFQLMV